MQAVVTSFTSAGWHLVDHYTALANFAEWYKKERARRGYCPGAPLPCLCSEVATPACTAACSA